MNAPHRGLWQRLGAAALSGLIITALAPSALAAPAGERASGNDRISDGEGWFSCAVG